MNQTVEVQPAKGKTINDYLNTLNKGTRRFLAIGLGILIAFGAAAIIGGLVGYEPGEAGTGILAILAAIGGIVAWWAARADNRKREIQNGVSVAQNAKVVTNWAVDLIGVSFALFGAAVIFAMAGFDPKIVIVFGFAGVIGWVLYWRIWKGII